MIGSRLLAPRAAAAPPDASTSASSRHPRTSARGTRNDPRRGSSDGEAIALGAPGTRGNERRPGSRSTRRARTVSAGAPMRLASSGRATRRCPRGWEGRRGASSVPRSGRDRVVALERGRATAAEAPRERTATRLGPATRDRAAVTREPGREATVRPAPCASSSATSGAGCASGMVGAAVGASTGGDGAGDGADVDAAGAGVGEACGGGGGAGAGAGVAMDTAGGAGAGSLRCGRSVSGST